MKYRTIHLAVLLSVVVMMAGCSVWEPSTTSRQEAAPTFDILDQYGWWVDLPGFGTAWQPDVDQSWRPYEYGHWIWTDQGWYWAGYEPFAWIVYHYGYWYRDPQMGWFWFEGHDWSPSRVAWIVGDDYAGWAPLPPPRSNLIEPWQEGGSALWAYVPYSGFLRENPSRAPGGTTVRHQGVDRTPAAGRKPPEVKTIEGATDRKVVERHLAVRDVEMRGKSWVKAELPSDDAVRVKAHAAEIAKVVHKRPQEPDKSVGPPRTNVGQESVPVHTAGAPSAPTPQPERKAVEKQEPARQQPVVTPAPVKAKVDTAQPAPKQPEVQKKDEAKPEKKKEASSKPDR